MRERQPSFRRGFVLEGIALLLNFLIIIFPLLKKRVNPMQQTDAFYPWPDVWTRVGTLMSKVWQLPRLEGTAGTAQSRPPSCLFRFAVFYPFDLRASFFFLLLLTSLLDQRQTASTNLPTRTDKATMKLNNPMSLYVFLVIVVTVTAMDLDPKCK